MRLTVEAVNDVRFTFAGNDAQLQAAFGDAPPQPIAVLGDGQYAMAIVESGAGGRRSRDRSGPPRWLERDQHRAQSSDLGRSVSQNHSASAINRMRPYLTIVRDSFHEALSSRVLWMILIVITIVLLFIAPLGPKGLRGPELRHGSLRSAGSSRKRS